ncbi:MAG: CcmD family protein [Bacteroidota bacterium]|nr:CcmD family protein [Bacteroidota bacterium]
MKKIGFLFIALITYTLVWAQSTSDAGMADAMRSNGKIYVVIAVILTIFAGIIIYLVRLDRKLSRLEKETKNQHSINK